MTGNRGLHLLSKNSAPILGQPSPEIPPYTIHFRQNHKNVIFMSYKTIFLGKVKRLDCLRKKNKTTAKKNRQGGGKNLRWIGLRA